MRRASRLFERLILAVAAGHHKRTMFSIQERLEIAQQLAQAYPNVEVIAFRGLLRDFVVEHGGKVVVRGLRAVSDFEYEFQMAGMNRQLMPDVETVFLTPSDAVPVRQRHLRARDCHPRRRCLEVRVTLGARALAHPRQGRLSPPHPPPVWRRPDGLDDHGRLHQLRRLRARVPQPGDLDGGRLLRDRSRSAAPSVSATSTSRSACRSARWPASRSTRRMSRPRTCSGTSTG